MRRVKSCGFFIFARAPVRGFLLLRTASRFDLPKGHMEPGETELETAHRELFEETGIAAHELEQDTTFRFETTYPYTRKNGEPCTKTLTMFLASIEKPRDLQLTEHRGFEWREWRPPHLVQPHTIDALLAAVEAHLKR